MESRNDSGEKSFILFYWVYPYTKNLSGYDMRLVKAVIKRNVNSRMTGSTEISVAYI